MASSEYWEWGEQKRLMLRTLIQTAEKVNEEMLQDLREFTANYIDNLVHPKTTDISVYLLREIWNPISDALREKGVFTPIDRDAIEKHATFLKSKIPQMGTSELHYLISELMNRKPITEIKPRIRLKAKVIPIPPE